MNEEIREETPEDRDRRAQKIFDETARKLIREAGKEGEFPELGDILKEIQQRGGF